MSLMHADDIAIASLPDHFERWRELLDLIRRSFASMDGIIDPPSSVHRLTLEALKARAREETVLVASIGDALVGCAFLADRGDHLYLGKLAVDPAHQGKGIGRRLVAAAEGNARKAGIRIIELQARIELTDNHATFRRLGFDETVRTAHPGFQRATSITMRKEIS